MVKLTKRIQQFLDKRHHHQFIDGEYKKSSFGDKIDVINPATEEIIGSCSLGTLEDVDKAVQSVKTAFRYDSPWRRMTPADRGKIISDYANKLEEESESIAQLVTLENGKLYKDALSSDAGGAVNTFRYYAGWATKIEGETLDISQKQSGNKQNFAFTRREPIGVVAAIVPWNFPVSIAAWKLAPALSAGCTVSTKTF